MYFNCNNQARIINRSCNLERPEILYLHYIFCHRHYTCWSRASERDIPGCPWNTIYSGTSTAMSFLKTVFNQNQFLRVWEKPGNTGWSHSYFWQFPPLKIEWGLPANLVLLSACLFPVDEILTLIPYRKGAFWGPSEQTWQNIIMGSSWVQLKMKLILATFHVLCVSLSRTDIYWLLTALLV